MSGLSIKSSAAVFAVAAAVYAGSAHGQCDPVFQTLYGPVGTSLANSMSVYSPDASFDLNDISSATQDWDGSCGSGTYPQLNATTGNAGGVPVTVTYIAGSSGTAYCGDTSIILNNTTDRQITRANVRIWQTDGSGAACPAAATLAHELGHALGIGEADHTVCTNIMSTIPADGHLIAPNGGDCTAIDNEWITRGECPDCYTTNPPSTRQCQQY